MDEPSHATSPLGVRPQCRKPSVKVGVLVDFRQNESPVVVFWSTSPFASFGWAHSVGSPIAAPIWPFSAAKPNVNCGDSPGRQNGAACANAGDGHPTTSNTASTASTIDRIFAPPAGMVARAHPRANPLHWRDSLRKDSP